MGRAKAVLRARAAAQRGEQAAGRGPGEGAGAPPAKQERASLGEQLGAMKQGGQCAPLPGGKRGIARRLWSRVETAAYRAYERLAGLSEERAGLGVELAAPVLRALGVPAPRIASSVTVSRPRAAVLRALHDAEGVRRFLQSVGRAEMGASEGAATSWAIGMGGRGRGRTGVVSLSSAPGERGTEVKAVLPGARPRGPVARMAGKLLAELPRRRLRGDLRRLRQWIEIGEIPTTVGQPSGRAGGERT
ncbi:hypothetical protein WMF37_34540 [Sorangium sp. So ce291]|uniref:hypothetical protein n=1 Tax=Sorangium sp. So ce291 TaxID=3133294 RepID=UPI003F620344